MAIAHFAIQFRLRNQGRDGIHDQYIQITGGTGDGSVTSSSQPAQQPTPSSTPSPSKKSGKSSTATAAPSPSSTPVPLSSNVHGQTAATQTCSNGAG